MVCLWIGVLLAEGCSRGEPPVYPVHGRVLWQGKPLAEATVIFHPEGGGSRSLTARTDRDGKFALTTHRPGDGAPAGWYQVSVEYRELVREGDEAMRVGRNLLPRRYEAPETSGLRCQVRAVENELAPFELNDSA